MPQDQYVQAMPRKGFGFDLNIVLQFYKLFVKTGQQTMPRVNIPNEDFSRDDSTCIIPRTTRTRVTEIIATKPFRTHLFPCWVWSITRPWGIKSLLDMLWLMYAHDVFLLFGAYSSTEPRVSDALFEDSDDDAPEARESIEMRVKGMNSSLFSSINFSQSES